MRIKHSVSVVLALMTCPIFLCQAIKSDRYFMYESRDYLHSYKIEYLHETKNTFQGLAEFKRFEDRATRCRLQGSNSISIFNSLEYKLNKNFSLNNQAVRSYKTIPVSYTIGALEKSIYMVGCSASSNTDNVCVVKNIPDNKLIPQYPMCRSINASLYGTMFWETSMYGSTGCMISTVGCVFNMSKPVVFEEASTTPTPIVKEISGDTFEYIDSKLRLFSEIGLFYSVSKDAYLYFGITQTSSAGMHFSMPVLGLSARIKDNLTINIIYPDNFSCYLSVGNNMIGACISIKNVSYRFNDVLHLTRYTYKEDSRLPESNYIIEFKDDTSLFLVFKRASEHIHAVFKIGFVLSAREAMFNSIPGYSDYICNGEKSCFMNFYIEILE